MSPHRPSHGGSDDDDIIAAARVGFLDEAGQMLQQFEESLLVLEGDPHDAECLNAAFRAAHTIKGTAGLFSCDAVVAFTHEVETVMEAMRARQIAVDEAAIAVLLRSRDQMERLLGEVDSATQDAEVARLGRQLAGELRALLGGPVLTTATADAVGTTRVEPDPETAFPAAQAPATEIAGETAGPGEPLWQVSLRFGADALRNGLDPLAFVRYLDQVGQITGLLMLDTRIAALADLDAEGCAIGVEIALTSDADRAQIEQVFDFVVDDCDIAIIAPDRVAGEHADQRLARLDNASHDADEHARIQHWLTVQGWRLQAAAQPLADHAPQHIAPAQAGAGSAAAGDSDPPAAAITTDAAAPAVHDLASAPDKRADKPDRRVPPGRRGEDAKFLRVRADKLDHLIDLIGELVIASSGAQLAAQQEGSAVFNEAALRIGGLVEEARDGALALRMVPIGETFTRFQRVVRDVSKLLGKEVELQISGGDTELDKTMVETIADPIMHLVRNSLDHGIEGADERIANGKPAQGHLALHAYHEHGLIFIEVSDDGRGLKRERIVAKAIERGLIAPDAQLSDHEVHQLIMQPGFSTADQVTDISGRGVGMDVVKRNIEALRGQIQIASEEGRGTTMQIRLPLTLAIIDGFLTSVADVHYIVPLEMVVECIETPPLLAGSPHQHGACGYVDLRGEVLPYLDLRHHFDIDTPRPPRMSLLVVNSGGSKFGLLVDRLHGKYQTVIKPLGTLLRHLRSVSGSTVLGSGEVGLVLDLPALLASVRRPAGPGLAAGASRPGHALA
ncbi:MAG: chemotaxis protein CheA [Pseudomonadota bacterium]